MSKNTDVKLPNNIEKQTYSININKLYNDKVIKKDVPDNKITYVDTKSKYGYVISNFNPENHFC